ncbi:hypothetical protein BYT27DRAFT_7190125 [Phlegmacium glaucopus]|nr:hypothetical protein BYT27DRAFT_7190125 [Phlegmacium glaucopus]
MAMGFWFITIPLGLCVLLIFFFVPEPETTYIRENQEGLESTTSDPEKSSLEDKLPSSVGRPMPSLSPKTYYVSPTLPA